MEQSHTLFPWDTGKGGKEKSIYVLTLRSILSSIYFSLPNWRICMIPLLKVKNGYRNNKMEFVIGSYFMRYFNTFSTIIDKVFTHYFYTLIIKLVIYKYYITCTNYLIKHTRSEGYERAPSIAPIKSQ